MNPEGNSKTRKELEGLLKVIKLKKKFNLAIASFTLPAFRTSLVQILNRIFENNTTLGISKNHFRDFQDFEDKLAQLSRSFGLIHLVNESNTLYNRGWPDFYKGLNYHRDKITQDSPVSIILWMLPQEVKEFALTAPDMWEWRTAVFDFELPAPTINNSYEQKTEEIQARVNEVFNYLENNPKLDHRLKIPLLQELAELYFETGRYRECKEYILKALAPGSVKPEPQRQELLKELLTSVNMAIEAIKPYDSTQTYE